MNNFGKYLLTKDYTIATTEGHISRAINFRQWLKDENIPLGQLSYGDVLLYIKQSTARGNCKRTLQVTVNTLKHYFNYLVEEGGLTANPAERILIKGARRRIIYDILEIEELEEIYHNYKNKGLAGKRNKIILGLIIYQGLNATELGKLEPQDVKLREGTIYVPGSKRSNSRELQLQAHQIIDIMDYINETRKLILAVAEKESNKLFISLGEAGHFRSIAEKLMRTLRKQDSRVKDMKQLRASVIVHWLKHYNLRKVQYLAGHRYISSTEKYQANNLEDLQEEISKYHPIR